MLLQDHLYRKVGNGMSAKCISEGLGMETIDQIHNKDCGLEGPTLARRVERMGYFGLLLSKKQLRSRGIVRNVN